MISRPSLGRVALADQLVQLAIQLNDAPVMGCPFDNEARRFLAMAEQLLGEAVGRQLIEWDPALQSMPSEQLVNAWAEGAVGIPTQECHRCGGPNYPHAGCPACAATAVARVAAEKERGED